MRQIPLTELSFLQIQIFLVAGKELNFTKTANSLFVTQPTVSRSIDSMERLTGLQLFIRDHNGLRLTPAGKSLYKSLTEAIDMIHTGFYHAWELQEGYGNCFNISYPYGTNPDILFQIAKRIKEKNKFIKIHYKISYGFHEELRQLFSYEVDFVITHMHHEELIRPYSELCSYELLSLPLTVFMTKTNRLSSKSHLTLKDIRSQKILFPKDGSHEAYQKMILEAFAKEDIFPLISCKVTTSVEGILNLQEDNEVLILNHLANTMSRDDCVKIPLEGSRSGLLLVLRAADADKPLTKTFIKEALSCCESFHVSEK